MTSKRNEDINANLKSDLLYILTLAPTLGHEGMNQEQL